MGAGIRIRTLEEVIQERTQAPAADDALDLVRMDDDGGWQMPPVPATRKRGTLTRSKASAARPAVVPDGS